MSDSGPPGSTQPVEHTAGDRLDSWKEIAAYLRRDVTTVQRWEKREGMPVHRHVHDKAGSVYAFRTELDAWMRRRNTEVAQARPEPPEELSASGAAAVGDDRSRPDPLAGDSSARSRFTAGPWRMRLVLIAAGAALVVFALAYTLLRDRPSEDPLAGANVLQLTDFGGAEHAAALSRDGRFVAFLSDRAGRMDVWVAQVGTGQFYNLTRGADLELVNPSIRTLGFSPDGALVTFWTRRTNASGQSDIGIWAAPVLGGPPRPYLEGVAEYDWSADGTQLVYHTPGPGDPMFVSNRGQPPEGRQVFSAPAGLHGHFLLWSPDRAFIYFIQGSVPDRMDIWRIRPGGGEAERITHHDSRVSHPVFRDPRTLMYLASDPDGSGPWLHTVDVERRIPQRVSSGVDGYSSLAASADGTRLVVTVSRPTGTLWRLPIADAPAGLSTAHQIALTTRRGSSPRLGSGYLLYVSSKGTSDGIWKLQGETATEVWSAADARILGGPAITRDGRRMVFSVRQQGQTLLYVSNTDGTEARVVTKSLALQGSPAWAPGEQSVTTAATVDGVPRLFSVSSTDGSSAQLVQEHSVDPAWAPDAAAVVFSGPDIGTTFKVKAVTADGRPYSLPELTLPRGARRLTFMPGRRALVVMRGELRHKNLWLIDLETGVERQLTDLPPDFEVRDFDIAPDGKEIVLEQAREQSDVVLFELPRR